MNKSIYFDKDHSLYLYFSVNVNTCPLNLYIYLPSRMYISSIFAIMKLLTLKDNTLFSRIFVLSLSWLILFVKIINKIT